MVRLMSSQRRPSQAIARSRMRGIAATACRRPVKRYQDYRTDCFVISHPRCGRTWLRVMLAKALALHFRLPHDACSWLSDVFPVLAPEAPRIQFDKPWDQVQSFTVIIRPPAGAEPSRSGARGRPLCRHNRGLDLEPPGMSGGAKRGG